MISISSSIPDLASLQSTEVELPTTFSLSGLINNVIELDQPLAPTKDEKCVKEESGQPLYLLVPPLDQPVTDIQSIMNGFGNSAQLNLAPSPSNQDGLYNEPWVEILEQPKSNSLRFRYECEGKGAGALQGKSSTQENKTFPKIKVHGFKGFATVVVSCVTHNHDPPLSHPHNLVSPVSVPNGCKFGICTQTLNTETMTAEFPHLGIQCVKRRDIKRSLEKRREKKVDPYRQGWKHIDNPQNIDLNAVKLCFHVWYEADVKGKCTRPMKPVCSDIIYDAKAKKELQICDISDTCSPVMGDKKIIILCEKVSRDDVKIRFFDDEGWEGYGIFAPSDVHKQYAISFNPPKYKDLYIKEKKRVRLELCKQNGETSEPHDFYYTPTEVRSQGLKENSSLKQEIKLEDANSFRNQQQQMSPRTPTSKSPYSTIQLGDHGSFVLSEKRTNDLSAEFSLTNIQPTFNPTTDPSQILLNLDPTSSISSMPNMNGISSMSTANIQNQVTLSNMQSSMSPVGGMSPMQDSMSPGMPSMSPGMANMSPGMPNMSGMQENYQAYSPDQHINPTVALEESNISFQGLDNRGEIMYTAQNLAQGIGAGLEQYYNLHPMTETVDNLSETLNQNMNIEAGETSARSSSGGGKRSQKDANLESGSIVLPYQQAKTDGESATKPNLSRQMSSLNTPTVSEQLTSGSSLAGGALNIF